MPAYLLAFIECVMGTCIRVNSIVFSLSSGVGSQLSPRLSVGIAPLCFHCEFQLEKRQRFFFFFFFFFPLLSGGYFAADQQGRPWMTPLRVEARIGSVCSGASFGLAIVRGFFAVCLLFGPKARSCGGKWKRMQDVDFGREGVT